MTEGLDRSHRPAPGNDTTPAVGAASVPLCFILDEAPSTRSFLSLVMHGVGIETEELADPTGFRQALQRRAPDLVFLDVGLDSAEVIELVASLGRRGYRGHVQLISTRGAAVMEHVRSIGQQHGVEMLPPLKKPFDANAIVAIIQALKLGHAQPRAARVTLREALANGWIEFWHQPKIDLRRKQLAGVEAFARCRHPELGVLLPAAFMPEAAEADLTTLSELAIASVIAGSERLSRLGINLRFAVNMPVGVLVKLSIPDLVHKHCAQLHEWPGLIIGVAEEQIVTDLALATELTRQLAHVDVKLAIDNFGRGYSSLARLKALPFAELKLDPTFVADCGVDPINAPLCKTVIDLAHNFGSLAVAIGIEKATDALALTSMGCDIGQGFLLGQPMPEDRFISLLRQRAAGQGRALAANG
ncbi:MAG: EAL domain-containing response regulator [Xanthobacteraceae bacterium]|nr:EAL domain-containing response regulator [Xanthobacteraceae bacterium]